MAEFPDLEPFDAESLLATKPSEADFVLDGKHYGRGEGHDGSKIKPVDVRRWRVEGEGLVPVASRAGDFYSEESYIVWVRYEEEKKVAVECSEVCFYWKGENAEKGYSPLPKEVAVDTPVERILQWSEIPIFLRIFDGQFVVHDRNDLSEKKLYIAKGSYREELHFFQVPFQEGSLRSRTSFVLVVGERMFVWHGCKCANRGIVAKAAERIWNGLHLEEIEEGNETEEFMKILNITRNGYHSLLDNPNLFNHSPRLFYFTSLLDTFFAVEVDYPLNSDLLDPFPFIQNHLYSANQPGLFMVDNYNDIWLWQGWKGEEFNEEEAKKFEAERNAALITAIKYWKIKFPNRHEAVSVVSAGNEPVEFTNLFPCWKHTSISGDLQIEYSQKFLSNKLKLEA